MKFRLASVLWLIVVVAAFMGGRCPVQRELEAVTRERNELRKAARRIPVYNKDWHTGNTFILDVF